MQNGTIPPSPAATMATEDDLPPELVRAVLVRVRPVDLVPCARVSRRWRALVGTLIGWSRRPKGTNFIAAAVRHSAWDLVEWAREEGCPWDVTAPAEAITAGRPDVFERLVGLGCPWSVGGCTNAAAARGDVGAIETIASRKTLSRDDQTLCAAARGGHLDALRLLFARGCGCGWRGCWAVPLETTRGEPRPPSGSVCSCRQLVPRAAALGGHNHVLAWMWANGCAFDDYAIVEAARGGHVATIQWLLSRDHRMDGRACGAAAEAGRLAALKWLRQNGCRWDGSTCLYAAHGGSLDTLQWAMANGCPWDRLATTFAAMEGHLDVAEWTLAQGCALVTKSDDTTYHHGTTLAMAIAESSVFDIVARTSGRTDVLAWLRDRGCACETWTFADAAEGGHLDVLQWLNDNCRPWDEGVCSALAEGGHFDALRYVREHGCPWDERVCDCAAALGHLEVLQWARANGCPWDRDHMCLWASPHCGVDVMRWLVAEGCPWHDRIALRVAGSVNEPDLLAWIDESGLPWDATECGREASRCCRVRVVEWIGMRQNDDRLGRPA